LGEKVAAKRRGANWLPKEASAVAKNRFVAVEKGGGAVESGELGVREGQGQGGRGRCSNNLGLTEVDDDAERGPVTEEDVKDGVEVVVVEETGCVIAVGEEEEGTQAAAVVAKVVGAFAGRSIGT
jgi:hypothetical protein